jgi:hypothetical protein
MSGYKDSGAAASCIAEFWGWLPEVSEEGLKFRYLWFLLPLQPVIVFVLLSKRPINI